MPKLEPGPMLLNDADPKPYTDLKPHVMKYTCRSMLDDPPPPPPTHHQKQIWCYSGAQNRTVDVSADAADAAAADAAAADAAAADAAAADVATQSECSDYLSDTLSSESSDYMSDSSAELDGDSSGSDFQERTIEDVSDCIWYDGYAVSVFFSFLFVCVFIFFFFCYHL